jgi:DNA modification methylase
MTKFINKILKLTCEKDIKLLRLKVSKLIYTLSILPETEIKFKTSIPKRNVSIPVNSLIKNLEQINKAQTIERARYYLNRLEKALFETKTNKTNDINLNRWKDYPEILTDSLWLFDKRDSHGVHNAGYWGNFIPQIPFQLLSRYTKIGEWVLDPFAGSGTTLIEALNLYRNAIGIEIKKRLVNSINTKISKEVTEKSSHLTIKVFHGDSIKIDIKKILKELSTTKVQFIIYHPPYWDIIKFSNSKNDLSNANSLEIFIDMFQKVLDNTLPSLEKKRYFAVIIGDKYSNKEWIPLGFELMNLILSKGHILKSIVVKNFEHTTGKRNQKELWRYRALAGDYYIFKHEYIFIFQKIL